MNVRRAEIDDIPLLQKVYASDGRKHDKPLSSYPLIDWIMKDINLILVAEKKRPVGFIIVRTIGDEANIDVISTKRSSRKTIEKALVSEAFKHLLVSRLFILLSDRATAIRKVYESMGFEVYDNLPNAFGKGRHAVKLMKKFEQKPAPKKKVKMLGGGVIKRQGPKYRISVSEDEYGGFLDANLKQLDMA